MNLTELRERVADTLAAMPEVTAGEWTVHATPVDAITPPAFLVQQGDGATTWFTPETMCADVATVSVLVIADRLTPEGENLPTLETMVQAAAVELATARLRPYRATPPAPTEYGQITYLAARLLITEPVTLGGTP